MGNVEIPDPHVYVFHHVPKCGGTSMVQALEAWFDLWWDYRPAWAAGPALEDYGRTPLPLDDLPPGALVCGHFEIGGVMLHERYPQVWQDPRYRVFTFVRDPLECRLSLLRFELEHGRYGEADVEERLLGRENFIQRVLHVDPTRMDEDLGRYFFIGLAEESQAGFDHLAARLGKPRLALPRVNRTTPRSLPITPAMVEEFRRRNRVDLALYARCAARWRRARRRGGPVPRRPGRPRAGDGAVTRPLRPTIRPAR
jgi:hypothetical protein